MSDVQISGTVLPAFDRIRAGEVEPAIRELLRRNRDEVATLEAQPHPTFQNIVLPLEQLSHRLSCSWSPISHLNGVLNSDELRASYNACLPLLSNYSTDLSQSEPLYRAYSVLDAMNAWSRRVTDPAELAGINPVIVEQARARAAEKGQDGWLFLLEQPAFVAVMQDAASESLRRDFYEAWSTRASDRGPSAGKYDNTGVMAEILKLRHEAARLLDFPNFAAYALATRMAPSTDAVFDFLHELARIAKPAAAREFAELE